jgi:hypothetical protein
MKCATHGIIHNKKVPGEKRDEARMYIIIGELSTDRAENIE